ncbi:PDZ domain-containing protein [Salsuginibacillus halophilus]|uniref:endopeptidase La n=1 Tax=Salsuginibacillus halophilus TaxID=517424 RepID=A0A2P8HX49_9BACI|nr:PDZ domain-containing protein [Salsuginibacillus halophilus]PSL50787.1 PDZ domain-containing protein [Salsuginibacillus halophilus]
MKDKPQQTSKLFILMLIVLGALLVYQIPLPYFYSQPGEAVSTGDMIEVENAAAGEGSFHLTTISQSRANPVLYIWATFSDYRNLVSEEAVLQEGETDEDYQHRQQMMMEGSQEAAKIAAYEVAGAGVTVDPIGILVNGVIDEMDAANHLEVGDHIQEMNGEKVGTIQEMNDALEGVEEGDEIELTLLRDGETITSTVVISTFPESRQTESEAGLGIEYPVADRDVTFDPPVSVDAGAIGGPSAGLIFALEIYDQLTDIDAAGELQVAGTGSIDETGTVGPVGGVSQKIVASDRDDIDIFFTPDDRGEDLSNHDEAAEVAEDIGSTMEIIPVETLQEAVDYLEEARE